uniref:Archaeal Lon protease n=1 Tax=uncultured euryarchaeote Rifle_16ft_4_minimus_39 TaxID=1665197 RepID=A0A0H4TBU0_9EURY|nr:ATP-dependent protease Lon [uncultured euryarchaeote Rifle_16ft_4_minimus_39]
MAKRFNSRTRVFEAYTKGLWDRGEMADTLSGPDDIDTVDAWIRGQEFRSTTEVKIPERLVDQVIGQESAVEVIRKAAEQKRHVLLIGDPGTGKSMLARSMTELLPRDELQDIIVYHNPEDPNEPKIRVVPASKGREIVNAQKAEAAQRREQKASMMMTILFFIVGLSVLLSIQWTNPPTFRAEILLFGILVAGIIWMATRYTGHRQENVLVPKLLVTHTPDEFPPFIDATGSHAGALLGDVKHDPFQSGGLETPAHERVEAGAIHKAHRGVLFVDEINLLRIESQQSLLTALQEKKFSIVGQSERSSGAMVKTEAVPCDFILVAAGNLDAVQGMHPALRSRVRGYGYEIYMKATMPDTQDNRQKLIRFVAQEVAKDKKIPHFDRGAVLEILREAQRRAGRRGQLTLRLRELGGLIRVAGDIAQEQGAPLVTAAHVVQAKRIARSLEQQVADRIIERGKEYRTFVTEGGIMGVVNGLAVYSGDSTMAEFSGIILPIAAEVTPAQVKSGGKIIATGRLGEIAKEAVENVAALIKKYTGEDISNHDIHVQFVGSREGTEGDSASISVATAVISALEGVEVDQSVAMTGSLSVRGQVLPVGGVTAKIEAAAEMGIRKVLIPRSNMKDVLLEDRYVGKIEIVPVENLKEVLEHALIGGPKKQGLLGKLAAIVPKAPSYPGLPGGAVPH